MTNLVVIATFRPVLVLDRYPRRTLVISGECPHMYIGCVNSVVNHNFTLTRAQQCLHSLHIWTYSPLIVVVESLWQLHTLIVINSCQYLLILFYFATYPCCSLHASFLLLLLRSASKGFTSVQPYYIIFLK